MTDGIAVTPVSTKRQTKSFLKVPFAIYRDDPSWVAPLFVERLEHLDPAKNPYFRHAEVQLFMASRGGEDIGRISAQIDRLRLERYDDATGQFGFIEAPDDGAVFHALFDAAESWLSTSPNWARRWAAWCELDDALPIQAFPAWCRLSRAVEFPLPPDSDPRPGAQWLRSADRLARDSHNLALRKALHTQCPALLANWLADRTA